MTFTSGPAASDLPRDVTELDRTWAPARGIIGWFSQVNHRAIGKRFIVTAFVFFILAGLQAFVMRLQLAVPDNTILDADRYNQFFTMHGTTMMFFFAVPVLEGFFIYLVPLMIGTRDMVFPRMNAFGYYVYLIAGVVLYASFFIGLAPDAGWFNYPPLSGPEYSPGIRIDFWATMITFIEVSALVAAVEIIVTILKQRAPGMSLNRMPLLVWAALVTSFMIVFAMPAVVVASVMLALDRTIGAFFFDPSGGGAPLLFQHLFWFFGHPEVYIILVPGLGFVSAIVAGAAKRPMFGYTAIAVSMVAIGFASFGLWVHHMYTTGVPALGSSFFTVASTLIAIPSGIQIFCWIATLWGSRPRITTPLLYVLGFVFIFVIGGITGVMVASVPFDSQVHDTFFVVAHFHYVLIGGSVFPLLGAVHYWFPKFTGRMMSEKLGKIGFWLAFIGFNVTFFPMHHLGFQGMPRRVYTYIPETGWGPLNLLATIGAVVLFFGLLTYAINVLKSARSGAFAGADPWNADSLEWATSSPPHNYNFDGIPVVTSRYPMWQAKADGEFPVAVGLRDDRREALVTSVLDAEPRGVSVLASPSIWPLIASLSVAVAFVGVIFNVIWAPIGAFLVFLSLAGWHWPREHERTPPWKERENPELRRAPPNGGTQEGSGDEDRAA
jgi:cytochrome c oxidase subunit I+III